VAQSTKLNQFVRLLDQLASEDGIHVSELPNVGLFRMSAPQVKSPILYEPVILLVAQGTKYCYVGSQRFDYSAGTLLTMFLPMPVATEIVDASPQNPFLAAGIAIDLGRLADVLLRIERADPGAAPPEHVNTSGIFSTPMSETLLDAAIRLIKSFQSPRDAQILGELIVDEIYYRLLCDERGGELRTLLQQRGEIQRISRAIAHIHNHIDQPVSVGRLADLVHMSRTSFFEHFKAVMHVSPLQYAKSLKLHKAQALLQEGLNASEAGYQVGYNSPAQFSREYKRLFGVSPSMA
jgi:AraC-like DNA-binding protein